MNATAKPLNAVLLDTMIGKHIGKVGTKRRDVFENKLKKDIKFSTPSINER